jgi:UDP-N-acetylmuramoyl-tripeptide--D-alanyl-D-alanine ligase
MIAMTVAELAAVLGAELTGAGDPEVLVRAVTADSRAVGPGSLFVALPGARVDGHAYVAGAEAAGAVAALTVRPVGDGLCLVVPDPLEAMGRLARHVVDRGREHGLSVVGITGSQGKTSTKDLLAQVLERAGSTVAPLGNLNNELGVPLTAARIEESTRFLVAELGARGIGHIAYLCTIVAPSVGVVLNVGHAHVGEFGGQGAIAKAKGELVESLPSTGWAVLNATDPLVWAMRTRTRAPVLAFAVEPKELVPADSWVWADQLASDGGGRYAFRLQARDAGGSVLAEPVQLTGVGRHQVANATAAAAAAVALGLELDLVAAGLSAALPRSRWRMELHETPDGVLVVNDAYNANPDSMRAAVETTVELGRLRSGRVVAVLGDMLELGPETEPEHVRLGELVAGSGVHRLIAMGEFAPMLAAAARAAGLADATVAADREAAFQAAVAGLTPGDVVLVKASRGLALNTVADQIVAHARPAKRNGDPA